MCGGVWLVWDWVYDLVSVCDSGDVVGVGGLFSFVLV